jgi:hypothetical protein
MVDTADERMGYLLAISSIEGDVEPDLAQSVEVPGGGYLYAPADGRYFLIGGSEALVTKIVKLR